MSAVLSIHDVVHDALTGSSGLFTGRDTVAAVITELEEREDAIAGRLWDEFLRSDLVGPEHKDEFTHILHRAFGNADPEPDPLAALTQAAVAAGREAREAHERWRKAWRAVQDAVAT
jgi:hypothetical protein